VDVFILIVRLVLSAVLLTAGVAKLRDYQGTMEALGQFFVPERLQSLGARFLPVVELGLAVALLFVWSGRCAAVGTCLLFIVFEVGIFANLRRGRNPDCHCFGRLHSEPVSWKVFVRNLVLLVLSLLVAYKGPGLSLLSALEALEPAQGIPLALILSSMGMLAVTLSKLEVVLKRQSALESELAWMKKVVDEDYAPAQVERPDIEAPGDGLVPGAFAPNVSLHQLTGQSSSLLEFKSEGKGLFLLFISPYCSACDSILTQVRDWQRFFESELSFVVITRGDPEKAREKMNTHGLDRVVLQEGISASEAFLSRWTPAAVLVHADGRIASRVCYGAAQINALVHYLTDSGTPPKDVIFRRREASTFDLQNVKGGRVSLEELHGKPTLLVLWDPECPPCRDLEGELRAIEIQATRDGPNLVFISYGKREVTVRMGQEFQSVIHDPAFETAPLFNHRAATPSAILLDEFGRIASPVVSGLDILELAKSSLRIEAYSSGSSST
jgi:thiol-disulfide isomerase/thioredoxin/uncharacterized membrane protein YphA (DoxX/SURF4 family)